MPKITSDSLKSLTIIILLILICPFIINCYFAYPQTDDFVYSVVSRDLGFFKAQHYWYTACSGRFLSTILLSINPLVYNSLDGYKLLFGVLIVAQMASIYFLADGLAQNALSKRDKLLLTLTLSLAFLDQMDDIRSGLYWMAGVVTYQVAESLLILFCGLMLFINRSQDNRLAVKCLAITLSLFLGGTNEIVLVLTLFITASIVCYNYATRKVFDSFQVAIFIMAVIGSCLGLLAPGNFARLHDYYQRKSMIDTLGGAIVYSWTYVKVWATSPLTLILMCMVFLAVTTKPQLRRMFQKLNVSYSLGMLLFLTFICVLIPYWCTGMPPQNRVINMIFLFFLIGWLINLAIIFSHHGETIRHQIRRIPCKALCPLFAAYMVALFTLQTSNFTLVTTDLLNGTSFRYDKEMQLKQAEIVNSGADSCKVEDVKNTPGSLFFSFISQNGEYWVNRFYADYFRKKCVTVIKKENSL